MVTSLVAVVLVPVFLSDSVALAVLIRSIAKASVAADPAAGSTSARVGDQVDLGGPLPSFVSPTFVEGVARPGCYSGISHRKRWWSCNPCEHRHTSRRTVF